MDDLLSGGADPRSERGSLALAYIGDAVYELLTREELSRELLRTSDLHVKTVARVNAAAQSAAARAVYALLTPQEREVFRRARNAKPHHAPQTASPGDYQQATALEAVFGWLYLGGDGARLRELFKLCRELSADTASPGSPMKE